MEQPSESSLFRQANERRERWRLIKDSIARHAVGFGGISVIIAILLIFFYLMYVVYPLFVPASGKRVAEYAAPGGGSTLYLATEEKGEIAVRYTADGRAVFFDTEDGAIVGERTLAPAGASVTTVAVADGAHGLLALGLSSGRMLVVQHGFKISYPDDKRTVTPEITYPYGEEPLLVDDKGVALDRLSLRDGEDRLLAAAVTTDGRTVFVGFQKQSSFLDESTTLERTVSGLPGLDLTPRFLLLSPDMVWLYVAAADGRTMVYEVRDPAEPRHLETVNLAKPKTELTSLRFLVGGFSLVAGFSDGKMAQWFPVRDAQNQYALTHIRDFELEAAPVQALAMEERRKGFAAADGKGRVGVYNTTGERHVLTLDVSDAPINQMILSPRADVLLAEDGRGQVSKWRIHNEHPEISWKSLWGKVHYEGYAEPKYIWQSSAANNDFEPKFSLTPLTFGTLKAAFYAMLFATPLAILGAIYTAYFMAPRMRGVVKPAIEIMGALPTVILGFLAGLWLAPFMENHLPAMFAILFLTPVGVLVVGFLWHQLPLRYRALVPDGWEAALLIPVILIMSSAAIYLSVPVEQALFGGDMRAWMAETLGMGFDQRNAMVVGIAMGVAVIPNIFSIAEDAIFSVPKHLTFGSLALGATPWQTLSRVVILTASPGIFSAVMIGLGRAVGETMIVLMGTGNTPVMDLSIFQGMRTLSANIAVEMPESEVDSTHYRILFLAALVLFMVTFFFNTLAEIVRQRLRRKYSNL